MRSGEEVLTVERRLPEAAMQGIMEQGGLVEIKLRKPGCGTTLRSSAKLIADPMAQAALELSQAQIVSSSAQCPFPSSTYRSSKRATSQKSQNSAGWRTNFHADAAESAVLANALWPVVSPDMSPTMDITVPSTAKAFDSSKLKRFDDSFTRGSPEASFPALNIEPGLPVLVVDDDLVTRTMMKRILTRLGCQVTCAENGEMALEMILGRSFPQDQVGSAVVSTIEPSSREPPLAQLHHTFCEEGKFAVVFLDNQMPIMSGLKVVERLRKLKRHDFVVGVTGNALLSGMSSLVL
jgi:CheY-like chemotaxis protein